MRLYGVNAVRDLLDVNPGAIQRVIAAEGTRLDRELEQALETAGLSVVMVSASELKARAGRRGATSIGVDLRQAPALDVEDLATRVGEEPIIVALDGITDPHNMGAIMRSAAAFGAIAVVTTERRSAPLNDAAVRASAGAVAHIPLVRVVNMARSLRALKSAGYWIAGTLPAKGEAPWSVDLTGPLVIVIGAEGPGIRHGVQAVCDLSVKLDLPGELKALNASVFAGIMLSEASRQRAKGGTKP